MASGRALSISNPKDLVGIWTHDLRTDVVISCDVVSEYFNLPPEQGIHGLPVARYYDAIHPDDRAELGRRIQAMRMGEDTLVMDYRVQSVIHGLRWVRSTGQLFRNRAGEPTYLSGYLINIDAPNEEADRTQQHADLVEHLIEARKLAEGLGETMLNKLIEAVMLEAGLLLAERLKERNH